MPPGHVSAHIGCVCLVFSALTDSAASFHTSGPYLDDPEEREKFTLAYYAMTEAFLALPFCLPGTDVWKGRQGRLYIIKVLTKAAARSKKNMREGKQPECLLDFWSQQVNMEIDEAKEQGVPPPFYSADDKMADSVMDFLFASQDASTSSLVWTVTLMAEHPDVLAKVSVSGNHEGLCFMVV